VICAFDGEGMLQPGMFGRISIAYDNRTDALVVPRTALLEGEADTAVFMVKAGKAQRVPVELGYVDGEWVEVRKGVQPGDQVVVAGKNTLRDGTAVSVIGEPASKPVAAAKPVANKQ
jgi:membrane fusion protein (multidrug efflux system)